MKKNGKSSNQRKTCFQSGMAKVGDTQLPKSRLIKYNPLFLSRCKKVQVILVSIIAVEGVMDY